MQIQSGRDSNTSANEGLGGKGEKLIPGKEREGRKGVNEVSKLQRYNPTNQQIEKAAESQKAQAQRKPNMIGEIFLGHLLAHDLE